METFLFIWFLAFLSCFLPFAGSAGSFQDYRPSPRSNPPGYHKLMEAGPPGPVSMSALQQRGKIGKGFLRRPRRPKSLHLDIPVGDGIDRGAVNPHLKVQMRPGDVSRVSRQGNHRLTAHHLVSHLGINPGIVGV